MVLIFVDRKKFKIFKKKPRYAINTGETKNVKTFKYSTNNPEGLRGIKAKKGNSLRYE